MEGTKVEGGNLIVSLCGRIDSNNSEELRQRLSAARAEHPDLPLVLDAADLTYISSAGLRVVMTQAKAGPVSVQNASPEVYEIFDITGFTSLIDVRRKPRVLSVKGCPVIGQGAIGTVYRLDADTVVKVYNLPDCMSMIENEQKRARQAFVKGIPTAIPFDIVRVGEKYGTVFELVKADNYCSLLIGNPEKAEEIIREYASLVKAVHAVVMEPGEVPDARGNYIGYVDETADWLGEELHHRLNALLKDMPPDLHAVHGDIHMKNVMCAGGEPLLIDMDTLSCGDPVFDFAGLFNTYCAFMEDDPANALAFHGMSADMCRTVYRQTLAVSLEGRGAEALKRAEDRAALLGYVRFLHMICVLGLGKPELNALQTEHTLARMRELAGRVNSLALMEEG